MANNVIKGLVVEIGGDTTKLGKALENVNKKSTDLSKELGQINKLLKFDPGNADLLAQKQAVLAEAVANTKTKLDTLKEAERQVQAQFEKGEASEEQVRALQREIIDTTKRLENYEKAARDTAKELDDLGKESSDAADGAKDAEKGADKAADSLDDLADSADDAGDAADGLGSKLGGLAKGGLAALTAGLAAAAGALVGSAEASREYRTAMGKLDTAFTTAGHSSETATATYAELQGVLGETDQAVEAANHLAKLTDNEKDLQAWTEICTGVYATFGDSLPIENLTEAANETAKVGTLTGGLADALNWAGVNEEAFQAQLDACSTEQERQALITDTLTDLYSDAAKQYKKTNAEVIRANKANEKWADSVADVGAEIEPVLTDVKMLGASMLSELMPGITGVTDGLRGMLAGDATSPAKMGRALSNIVSQLMKKLTNMLPMMTQMATNLVTSLTGSLVGMLPQLVTTGAEIIVSLMSGLSAAIPQIVAAITEMLPQLMTALESGLPLMLQGVIAMFTALVSMLTEQIPVLLPQLMNTLVSIVTLLVEQLPVLIPQVVELIVSVIELLAEQLPVLIPQLVTMLVDIVTLLVEQLPVIIPMLIAACITIVMELIAALPDILVALTDALPAILKAVWDAIVMVFTNLPEWFGQLFQGAVDIIKSVFGAIVEWFEGIWESIKEAFASVGAFFSDIFSKAWDGIKKAWSGVKTFFSDIWSGIKNTFSPVTDWFKTLFKNAWSGIKNAWSKVGTFFDTVWDGVKKPFTSAVDWFKNIFSNAWDAVKKVFSPMGEVFVNIKDGIVEAFKAVVNALIKGINKVVALPFNGLNGILNTLHDLSILGVQPFGWLDWRAPIPQIPLLATGGVLKKGQVGLLEGDGAEAVVPLEKNTEWIRKVAQEFLQQVTQEAGAYFLNNSTKTARAQNWIPTGMVEKLDKILAAIERGQVLTIDGDALVGATADRYDSTLGQRRALAARGAL